MAENSKIEWTNHRDNLWHGCTKVHEGCDHCYAETLSKRWGNDIWGNDKPRKEIGSVWADFQKQQKLASAAGEFHRVFVGSMMDIFEKPMPLINSKAISLPYSTGYLRDKYFQEIVPATPNLIHLMLTKRPSNINKYIPSEWKATPPVNVMFGTSPVNQETMNKLGSQLIEVEGNRFLSIEPMLGPIELPIDWADGSTFFDWIICGGESGHGARPMKKEWAISLRDQCRGANCPFFFKQWGEYNSNGEKVGKKEAGRILDGQIYSHMPKLECEISHL